MDALVDKGQGQRAVTSDTLNRYTDSQLERIPVLNAGYRRRGVCRMSWVGLIVFVILIFAVVVGLKIKAGAAGGTIGLPYRPAKNLFSAAEGSFLGVLDQAVGAEHRVFGKVRVADVASVKSGLTHSARQGALNRIASKHFDFIVCRASDLSVVCAVELNDKSHASKRAQARDDFLAKVCQAIDLPLLTVPAKQSYAPRELREQFLQAVGVQQLAAPSVPNDSQKPG